MTRSRSLATAAVAVFCLAGGGVPRYPAQEEGEAKDATHHGCRTFIDIGIARTFGTVMGVDAFSPSAGTTFSVRPGRPSPTLAKRRRSMHILSYRPDQASQTDPAGPILWQYIFFGNWDETYVRVLKHPQESTYVSPNGWTPLHLLMTGSGFPPPLKVVKAVYAAFPQALRMPTNDYGRTPLDLAKRTDQSKEIIDFLESPPKLEGDDDYYVQPRAVMADDLDDGVCIDIDEDGACIVMEDDDDDDDDDGDDDNRTADDFGVNAHAKNNHVDQSSTSNEELSSQPQSSPSRPSQPKKVSVDSTISQQVEEQRRYQEQLRRKLEQRQLEEQIEYDQYQERYYSQQTMMMEEERRRQQLLMEQQQEEAMQRQRRQYIEQQKQQQGFAPRQPFHSATAANTANGSSSSAAKGQESVSAAGMPNAAATAQQQANRAAIQQMVAPLQDRIDELTTMYDALTRTKEQDAAKIESLEKELQRQRDTERQMRSAHYAEINEAQEVADERLVEYKEEIQRLKDQFEEKTKEEENVESDGKVVNEVEDLRKQVKLLTKELDEKKG